MVAIPDRLTFRIKLEKRETVGQITPLAFGIRDFVFPTDTFNYGIDLFFLLKKSQNESVKRKHIIVKRFKYAMYLTNFCQLT